jgi:hypothetical protein
MLFLQAFLSLMKRSVGKILEALFGWAVLAVFGRVSRKDQALFSAAIGAAAAWPILLLGILMPGPVALVVALLPIPRGTSPELIRGVWIALAAAVPIAVGLVFQRRSRRATSRLRRLAAGFPITAALAAAFLIVCVAIPIRKLGALFAGWNQGDLPLISPPGAYREVAGEVRAALRNAGFPVASVKPPWHARALSSLMRTLGGEAFSADVPEELEVLRDEGLEVTIYPGGVTILGPRDDVARAQAVISERATRTPAHQTTSAEAQEVENEIHRLWMDIETSRSRPADPDLRRISRLFQTVAALDVDYEEWETVYRQTLQIALAMRGDSSLLETAIRRQGSKRASAESSKRPSTGGKARTMSRRAGRLARRRLIAAAPKKIADAAERVAARLFTGKLGR